MALVIYTLEYGLEELALLVTDVNFFFKSCHSRLCPTVLGPLRLVCDFALNFSNTNVENDNRSH